MTIYATHWPDLLWVFLTACALGCGWTLSTWVTSRILALGDRPPRQ
jgi:hypothetical protein